MPKPKDLRENVPLAPLTTLNVGGNARYFVRPETEEELLKAFEFARSNGFDIFVLGGGSNILISDEGIDALVIHIGIKGVSDAGTNAAGLRLITAGAGEDWDEFVNYCVANDLAGVECLSGIPGFVGGTPIQNVGAYGQDVSETIVSVRCLDRTSGEIIELSNAECVFSYRKSIFNTTHRNRFIVVSVTFALVPSGEPAVKYRDLKEVFRDGRPTLREVRDAVISIRRSKSMVIDAADPNSRSVGSFFKNPEISGAEFTELKLAAVKKGLGEPQHFAVSEGIVKVPAAWLIENAGFEKGYRIGRAGISANHALAIINAGGASAGDILALKETIQQGVEDAFGVRLLPEPVFVGFGEDNDKKVQMG